MISTSGIQEVVRSCTKLEIINLIDACAYKECDSLMEDIASSLPHLQELELKNATELTSFGLSHLFRCQQLRILNLDLCQKIDDR
jgi:hypothetical protein